MAWNPLAGARQDPLTWSVPFLTIGRARLHLHVVFIVLGAAELIGAVVRQRAGAEHVPSAVGAFLLVAALRELVRMLLLAMAGGAVQPAVLWGLGAITEQPSQRDMRRELVAASGAIVFNAVMLPVLALAVRAVGLGWDAVLFNPLELGNAQRGMTIVQGAVWWIYVADATILAMNVLVPAPPLDASRLLACVLRPGMGETRGAILIGKMGMVAAAVVISLGAGFEHTRLTAFGVLLGATSWVYWRRIDFRLGRGDCSAAGAPSETARPPVPKKDPPEPAEVAGTDEDSDGELDRVLGMISREGLVGLNARDRAFLERETRRRRGG